MMRPGWSISLIFINKVRGLLIDCIIKRVALFKSSLLLKNYLQDKQTLQLN
jgi:hypothetical protein